jgi:hypothetical protein
VPFRVGRIRRDGQLRVLLAFQVVLVLLVVVRLELAEVDRLARRPPERRIVGGVGRDRFLVVRQGLDRLERGVGRIAQRDMVRRRLRSGAARGDQQEAPQREVAQQHGISDIGSG